MSEEPSNLGETQSEVQACKATPQDSPTLTQILVRAFDADPWVNWMIPGEKRRSERATAFMDWFVKTAMPHGHVYTTDDRNGVALWVPPDTWHFGLREQFSILVDFGRVTGLRHVLSRMIGIQALEQKHPQEPHYYLPMIGTDPAFRRKGIGSALLGPILRTCDEEGIIAYLENTNENNLPFYERHGFQLTEVFQFPFNGPQMWMMLREPRSVS
jgi:ribosomal protein S18 acetylase RimI-like enzyme